MEFLQEQLVEPLGASFWVEVGLAILCGGLLGFERQIRGKPCGIRTSMLVSLGTILFLRLGSTMVGIDGADPTRVLGQVVVGIGFLGAGAIMSQGGAVTGLTSAATIWVLAAISAAIGSGLYAVAVTVTLIALAVLTGIEYLQGVFRPLRRGDHADERNSRF